MPPRGPHARCDFHNRVMLIDRVGQVKRAAIPTRDVAAGALSHAGRVMCVVCSHCSAAAYDSVSLTRSIVRRFLGFLFGCFGTIRSG